MKTMPLLLIALAASPLAASPLAAQSGGRAERPAARPAAPAPPTAATDAVVGGVRDLWQISRDYLLAAAEQMPESGYAFRPTPEVRSFGELVGHVANAHRLLCAMVLGEEPAEERKTTKADLVAALRASNEYCARAYAISDAEAMQPLSASAQRAWTAAGFGTPRTRLYALTMNAWHDNEHYGNVVTYMRLEGMVPPSSQPRK